MDLLPLELIGVTLFQLSEMEDYVGLGRCRKVCSTWKVLIDRDESKLFKPMPSVSYLRWYYGRPFGRIQLEDIVLKTFTGHSMEAIRNMKENDIPTQFNKYYTCWNLMHEKCLSVCKAFVTLFGLTFAETTSVGQIYLTTDLASDIYALWYFGRAATVHKLVCDILRIDEPFGFKWIYSSYPSWMIEIDRTMNTSLIQLFIAFCYNFKEK
jgi:hypothetical protein